MLNAIDPNKGFREHPNSLIMADGLPKSAIRMTERDKIKNRKRLGDELKTYPPGIIAIALMMGDHHSHLKSPHL